MLITLSRSSLQRAVHRDSARDRSDFRPVMGIHNHNSKSLLQDSPDLSALSITLCFYTST